MFPAPFHTPIKLHFQKKCSDNLARNSESFFYSANSGCAGAKFLTLAKRHRLFHRHSMESHELLREIFTKKNPKEVSADLELSTSMIYKWAQPPGGEGSGIDNPLDRIEALIQSTGDQRLVQWICQRAGGFFILNPANAPHPHFLIPATNQIVQEFADLLAVIATAAADNKITTAEAEQIRARWEELKTATEGFVASCENGNFDSFKNKLAKEEFK
jgi:hypothetical protein